MSRCIFNPIKDYCHQKPIKTNKSVINDLVGRKKKQQTSFEEKSLLNNFDISSHTVMINLRI